MPFIQKNGQTNLVEQNTMSKGEDRIVDLLNKKAGIAIKFENIKKLVDFIISDEMIKVGDKVIYSKYSGTDVKLDEVNTDISLNPALALPIGSVHAHMIDLLSFVDSSFVNTDENNGIYIYF